jgi:hypothetical protein
MCFSANASFVSSAVLGVVGVAALNKVKTSTQLPFAAIPLLFGIQQASEGILWVMLGDTSYVSYQHIPTLVFLLFAQIIWPTWIPFSIMLVEKNEKRRKLLKVFTGVGAITSGYLGYCLITYDVHAEIAGYHIHYFLDFPLVMVWLSGIVYFIATVIPPFASGERRMQFLGVTILISYIFSTLFYKEYLLSIWCFFAAFLSGLVYLIMDVLKGEHVEKALGLNRPQEVNLAKS